MQVADELRVEEYKSLRSEIIASQQIESQYMLAAMTAAGTFLGFAANFKAIYLCIPPLLILAAIAKSLHSRWYYVGRIAQYIRVAHEDRFEGAGPRWESDLNRFRALAGAVLPGHSRSHARTQSSLLKMLAWGCPITAALLLFVSLVRGATSPEPGFEWNSVPLVVDVCLVAMTLLVFLWTVRAIGSPIASWSPVESPDLEAIWRAIDVQRRVSPLVGEEEARRIASDGLAKKAQNAREFAYASLEGRALGPNPDGSARGSGPGGTLTAADLDKYLKM